MNFPLKKISTFLILVVIFVLAVLAYRSSHQDALDPSSAQTDSLMQSYDEAAGPENGLHPLMIQALRQRGYPGSEVIMEQTLEEKAGYEQYVVSYLSDGFKVYAHLTVPKGQMPDGGWPAIIFNHGSISPREYTTTGRYIAYVDYFAKRGYVVFKSDYRGHGKSGGLADGGWYAPTYVIDVLNATASVKNLPYVNPEKIGMSGHSMGGHLTVSSMVISKDIKAGVIWAGLTATHDELFDQWRARRRRMYPLAIPSLYQPSANRRQELIDQFGTWQENPKFWQAVAPTSFLADLSGPLEFHHGTADERVPLLYAEDLKARIEAGKQVELYIYSGADHNLSQSFSQAMARSVAFFDYQLKSE